MTFKEENRMSPVESKTLRKHAPSRLQKKLIKVNLQSIQLPSIKSSEEGNAKNKTANEIACNAENKTANEITSNNNRLNDGTNENLVCNDKYDELKDEESAENLLSKESTNEQKSVDHESEVQKVSEKLIPSNSEQCISQNNFDSVIVITPNNDKDTLQQELASMESVSVKSNKKYSLSEQHKHLNNIPLSHSFDSSLLRKVSNGPTYERTLLKNRHNNVNGVNETTLDYHSDESGGYSKRSNSLPVKENLGSLDRKISKKEYLLDLEDSGSDTKRKNSRHHSFNRKKSHHINTEKGYDSASPNLIRKIDNLDSQTRNLQNLEIDSNQSSATENDKDDRKTRKSSWNKRRKSNTATNCKNSKNDASANDDEKSERERRPSKFRRRRSSVHATHGSSKHKTLSRGRLPSLGTDNITFSIDKECDFFSERSNKILLYSGRGNNIQKSSFEVNLLKFNTYNDILTDHDDSSVNSDVDSKISKQHKSQRGFAMKVWRSINSLFQPEEKVKKVQEKEIPSMLRNNLKHSESLSQSLPSIQQKSKLYAGNINRISKDDTYLEKLYREMNKSSASLSKEANARKKIMQLFKPDKKLKHSRSLDQLLDTTEGNRNSTEQTHEWLRRTPASSTVKYNRRKKHDIEDEKFNVVISQIPDKKRSVSETKDDTFRNRKESLVTFKPNKDAIIATETPSEQNFDRTIQPVIFDLKSILLNELTSFLNDKFYEVENITFWCRTVSEGIKHKVTSFTGDSCKVVVQVFIGALFDDGIHAAVQSTCNRNTDGFFAVTYKGKDLFAMASILTFHLED